MAHLPACPPEEIVAEILSIAPLLLKAEFFEALERLLQRAECFVRPLFVNDDNDDASAPQEAAQVANDQDEDASHR